MTARPKEIAATVERVPEPEGWFGLYYDGDSDPAMKGWYVGTGQLHKTKDDAGEELLGFRPYEGSAVVYISPSKPKASEALTEAIRALVPFAEFARQFDKQPLRNSADEVYSIHIGTEWEAHIKLSDMRRALNALAAVKEEFSL